MKPFDLQAPINWSCVDLGGETIRWSRISSHALDAYEILEAPTLVSLGPDLCFVQAAQRIRSQLPEWNCPHLISLTDFETPTLHRDLIEARDLVAQLHLSSHSSLSLRTRPLTPLLSTRSREGISLMTAHGERQPTAILSELVNELLNPPQILGEEQPESTHPQALIWLTSPSETPYRRAALSHIFSELSIQNTSSFDRSVAMGLGLNEYLKLNTPQSAKSTYHWATLDIGATQAHLSIMRLDRTQQNLEVLSQIGHSGVGSHALERRLLQGRLSLTGQSWSNLSHLEKARCSIETHERVYWALRHAWPSHLGDAQFARMTSHEIEITQRYLEELTQQVKTWFTEMLIHQDLLLETLDGLWITGSVGLALQKQLNRDYPNLRVRYAPNQIAMMGLISYVHSFGNEDEYDVKVPLSDELWLSSDQHPPIQLISHKMAPGWIDQIISPSTQVTALWLCSPATPTPTLWATHPPFTGEARRLQIAYQSPYDTHITWQTLKGTTIPPSEGAWSLALPHHPHAMTSSSQSTGAFS